MVTCDIHQWGHLSDDDLGPLGIDYYYLYYCSPFPLNYIIVPLIVLWIIFLINMLAQTASNYFSPTLSKICEKLNLAYDIAGVTFLAFGNGAPDFFSLIASFSGGVDVLVGVGALLGGSMFVCTVVVGSIAILCPCEVSKPLFLRDISFHLTAVCSVFIISCISIISIQIAVSLLCLYLCYACIVIFFSCFNKDNTSENLIAAGDIVMRELSHPNSIPSHTVQTAFWHPDPKHKEKLKKEQQKQLRKSTSSFLSSNPLLNISSSISSSSNSAPGGYSFLILKDDDTDDDDPETGNKKKKGSGGDKKVHEDEDDDGTINISGGYEPDWKEIIIEDYYSGTGKTSNSTQFTIGEAPDLDNVEDGRIAFSRGGGGGGGGGVGRRMIDESNDNSLEQSLLPPEEEQPHLQEDTTSIGETTTIEEHLSRTRIMKIIRHRNLQKYQNVLSSLYWQQWSLRRKVRHNTQLIISEWETYSFPYKCYLYIEYPWTFARDLTIPNLDDGQWNKMYAVLHPITCPLFILFITNTLLYDIGSGFPLFLLCFLIGCIPSILLYLYTTNSRQPQHSFFKILWTFTAFIMCVMWIFTFAGELISCLSTLGNILSIPPAFLGLTILAWGNSIGDFFTNTAVAKQGLGAMAIAGCYAGPVFNILMGFGTALVYATVQSYPQSYRVNLDASSMVSIAFLVVALTSTIGIVSYRDFKLDRIFGFYLISLYVVYSVTQITLVAFHR
jgi:Ca2+/Na+ antiporter